MRRFTPSWFYLNERHRRPGDVLKRGFLEQSKAIPPGLFHIECIDVLATTRIAMRGGVRLRLLQIPHAVDQIEHAFAPLLQDVPHRGTMGPALHGCDQLDTGGPRNHDLNADFREVIRTFEVADVQGRRKLPYGASEIFGPVDHHHTAYSITPGHQRWPPKR